jgi:DHA3 family macrolide efflux protein-like MFS transporter
VIAGGYMVLALLEPVINTASQVIWQLKVPPGLQGRVFSLRRMLAQAAAPLAIVLAGPLADRVFEPLMAGSSPFARVAGAVIGQGPGRGIALMFILAGVGSVLLGTAGWMHPRVRHLESEVPDLAVASSESAGDAAGAILPAEPDAGPE